MKSLSFEDAYLHYRKDAKLFFSERIHSSADDESSLINPSWPAYQTTYHYNQTENGIIEMLRTHLANLDTPFSVLDIGAGTGHWIDFYRNNFKLKRIVAIDFCNLPLKRLQQRIADPIFEAHCWDIAEPVPADLQPSCFDIINAIGVMFHIVDDNRWRSSMRNLSHLLAPCGMMIVGGDFGPETTERGVMRKNRSLESWKQLGLHLKLEIQAVRRFDWWAGADHNGITDNLLLLRRTDV